MNDEQRAKNLKGGKKFTSEYQPTPEAKRLGQLKAKTIKEWQAQIREKVFAEFCARDLQEYTNKELNQLVGTVWKKEDTEDRENNEPIINYVENLNEDDI